MPVLHVSDDGRAATGTKLLDAELARRSIERRPCHPVGNWSGFGSHISLAGVIGRTSTPMDWLRWYLGHRTEKIDMVFSGVNDGANIGRNILLSGTVCLAAYAAEEGLPAAAISQHRTAQKSDWRRTEFNLHRALDRVFQCPPPAGAFYNINLPYGGEARGYYYAQDRGKGGWLTSYDGDNQDLKWDGSTDPERMLDQGYIVFQCLRPFTCENIWGESGGAGVWETKKGALP